MDYWIRHRQEIHAWLQEQAPSLAELYKGAVCLLFDSMIPGRIRFVSHAVREIRNRLPGEVGPRLEYPQAIEDLLQGWINYHLPLDSVIQLEDSDSVQSQTLPQSPDVVIPRSLFLGIQRLLQKHSLIPRKNQDRATRLFERFVPEAETTPEALALLVAQWWKTTEWFMRKTHDNGRVDADCNEQELLDRFEEFEFFLSTLSQNFYSNTDELDRILEETND